jgi:tRNA(Ile)-lysidine synthase
LKKYGFTNPVEQQKIFEADSGSQFKGNTLNFLIHRDQLIITHKDIFEEETAQEIILIPGEPISFPEKCYFLKINQIRNLIGKSDLQKVAYH